MQQNRFPFGELPDATLMVGEETDASLADLPEAAQDAIAYWYKQAQYWRDRCKRLIQAKGETGGAGDLMETVALMNANEFDFS